MPTIKKTIKTKEPAEKKPKEKPVKKTKPVSANKTKPSAVEKAQAPLKARPLAERDGKTDKPSLETPDTNIKKARFIETTGRRKEASARVRLFTQGAKEFLVNQKPLAEYFKTVNLRDIVLSPVEKLKIGEKFGFSARVSGGGVSGQAEAVRHAIARALVQLNPYFKKRLKKLGFLTRDSRMRERKKFGLKRARRAPQWSKR